MPRAKIKLSSTSEATAPLSLPPGFASVPVNQIRLREHGDTRDLNAAHVVLLAESIGVFGVLEPVIIDTKGNLLAGGHRLAALQLLAIADPTKRESVFLERCGHTSDEGKPPTKELGSLVDRIAKDLDRSKFQNQYPDSKIPVAVVDASGKEGKSLSLAIEAAENTVRRQYSTEEIQALAERYKEAGYVVSTGGRPKKGERTVMDALEAALGRSKRQIQRILQPGKAKRGKTEWDRALAAFSRAAARVATAGAKKEGEAEKAVLAAAEKAAKSIEKLKGA